MRLLGIGDNSERVVIRGSDFEMMQMVAEEVRYLLDEQGFCTAYSCFVYSPSGRNKSEL